MPASKLLLPQTIAPLRPAMVTGPRVLNSKGQLGTTVLPGDGHDVPLWPRASLAGVARSLLQAPAFAALGLLAPAHVSGLEALEKIEGPVLFAANHTSHLDTPVLLKVLPHSMRRRVVVAAAADYFFSKPWLGALVAFGFNAFPFARTSCAGVRATLAQCDSLVESGWSILLYPEGTRSASGAMGTFKPGLGLLAVNLGVPVVPICTEGLFHILPKGKCVPRPGRATVRFGEPLTFTGATHYRDAAQSIEDAVHALASRAEMGDTMSWAQIANY